MKGLFTLGIYIAIGITGAAFGQVPTPPKTVKTVPVTSAPVDQIGRPIAMTPTVITPTVITLPPKAEPVHRARRLHGVPRRALDGTQRVHGARNLVGLPRILKIGDQRLAREFGRMSPTIQNITPVGLGEWIMDNRVTIVLLAFLIFGPASKSGAESVLQQIGEFAVPEANQGVGVDAKHFYAVDNQAIGKYDKTTGKLVKKWQGDKKGPFLHLDSARVRDGKIYAAHSNYPDWPMTSSLEIFDAETIEHMGTRSFGIQWGALNWVDWHDGHWWMTFANYDLPIGPNKTPYGHKANTLMVKLTRDFRPAESWTFPKVLLDKFELMSNSGGSWGADGFLYLTGHDPAELYRARLPKAGSVLELVNTIPMNIRGQGIAWDRSQSGTIYGIIRATAMERLAGGSHRVTVFKLSEKP